jgi:redox-sensitive bicupin YhaK (pirin superfamily)
MSLKQIVQAMPARDGAGVNIHRIAGNELHLLLDPYLMIDEIRSAESHEYMAGFPSHPHRGIQHGPFVMNTLNQIQQTLKDYAAGRLIN